MITTGSILGFGADFDKRIEEQRRKFDEERKAFEARLKALQGGNATKESISSKKEASIQLSEVKSVENDADNEADSSIDQSLAEIGEGVTKPDKDASDLMWVNNGGHSSNTELDTKKSTKSANLAEDSKQSNNRVAVENNSPDTGNSSQGSPASNDENTDLSRVNTSQASPRNRINKRRLKAPFSTPPRNSSTKAPLSSPPPSLFKTDIVDRVVEQHAHREGSSVSTLLSFVSSDSDEHESEQASVEL